MAPEATYRRCPPRVGRPGDSSMSLESGAPCTPPIARLRRAMASSPFSSFPRQPVGSRPVALRDDATFHRDSFRHVRRARHRIVPGTGRCFGRMTLCVATCPPRWASRCSTERAPLVGVRSDASCHAMVVRAWIPPTPHRATDPPTLRNTEPTSLPQPDTRITPVPSPGPVVRRCSERL